MTHLITYITYDHVCVSLFRSFREELTKELINEPTQELNKRTLQKNPTGELVWELCKEPAAGGKGEVVSV